MVNDDFEHKLGNLIFFSFFDQGTEHEQVFTRPGEAGAVLQTPLLLIKRVRESSFVKISSKDRISQTIRARDLKCYVSHVTCQVSHATCHEPHVKINK